MLGVQFHLSATKTKTGYPKAMRSACGSEEVWTVIQLKLRTSARLRQETQPQGFMAETPNIQTIWV